MENQKNQNGESKANLNGDPKTKMENQKPN